MDSPGHRANILARGIERFGFGITADPAQGVYAVQTFAGPGVPRELDQEEQAAALPPEAQPAAAARLLNEARGRHGLPALKVSAPLVSAARALVPDDPAAAPDLAGGGDLLEAIPAEHRAGWRAVAALAGSCTGCGERPSEADLVFFRDQWLDEPRYRSMLLDPSFSGLGFALRADGAGGKSAVAVLGTPR